jgi:RHS repeat-associated protein
MVNVGLNITHDTAGNQTEIGAFTFQYDGENRLSEVTANNGPATYAYDGEGRRVKRTLGGQTTVYVYSATGELAAEYGGDTNGGGVKYLTADALGSTRLVTKASGSSTEIAASRRDYLPFGEEIPAGVGGRSALWSADATVRQKFTGKERGDALSENGLDYFGARYYSGAQGRFTSVDPIWITKERMLDPQRLNLYAYGRNNPLRYIDPDGMDITLGRCATGNTQECYNQVLAGLPKEDRSHVHLVQGDGTNGFKKGVNRVTVDADHKSDSKNFQTLQTLAGDRSASAQIDVLKPNDKFDVQVTVGMNVDTGRETMSNMSMTPGNPNDPNSNSFVGYTFFPRGKGVPGPYSTGNFTDVVVNTVSPDGISSTIHHELRHVLLGDFGRVAPYGAHGTGSVDRQTTEAEKEAIKNSRVK